MQRRKFVLGLGSLTAAGAAAMGSGAFSTAEATRDATVEVADDSTGYLALQQSGGPNGEFASQNANGKLTLDFSGSSNGGSGVGQNSVYNFDNVFTATNQGTQIVYVWTTLSGGSKFDNSNFYLYPNGARSTQLNDGSTNVLTLSPGESAEIGVHVDTGGLSMGSDTITATFQADVDKPSGSGSVGPTGDQTLVVSQNPNEGDFGSIQNAIDNADGTDVLVEAGTYKETITIDKDDLTLRSLGGANQTTIRASTADANVDFGTGSNKAVLVDGAKEVTIDGFTVTFDSEPADNSEKYAIRGRPDGSGGGPDNLTVRNNIIEDFSTSDQPNNSGAVRASGIVVDMNPTGGLGPATTTGVEIKNNIIQHIKCVGDVDQSDSRAKGVSMNGDVQNAVIMDNTIHNIGATTNDDPNVAEELANTSGVEGTEKPRGITLTEEGSVGPTNFQIVRNDFDGIEGTYGQPAIFVGGSNSLGGNHVVRFNNFRHPVDSLSDGELKLRKNWWSRSPPPNEAQPDKDEDGGILINRGSASYDEANPRSNLVGDAGASL